MDDQDMVDRQWMAKAFSIHDEWAANQPSDDDLPFSLDD